MMTHRFGPVFGAAALLAVLVVSAATPALAQGSTAGVNSSDSSNTVGLITNSTERLHIDSSGHVGIGTTSPNSSVALDMGNTTGAVILPIGTTGQEPTGVAGMVRYNTTKTAVEAYYSGVWNTLLGNISGINLGTSASTTNPSRVSDATTGLFSPASDATAISAGGVEWLRVNDNGVGIGTTNPLLALDVALFAGGGFYIRDQAGTAGTIKIGNAAGINEIESGLSTTAASAAPLAFTDMNAAHTWMTISAAGNVGIGTTSPTLAKLQTAGMVGNTAAIFGSDTTGISLIGSYPTIGFNSYFNSGFLALQTGYGGQIAVEQVAGAMIFDTAASVTGQGTPQSMTERMRITNSGNVGIGITAPNAKLDVFSGSAMGLTVEGNSQLYPVVNTYFNVSSNFSNGWAETDIWNAVDPATFTSTGIRFLQRLTASTSRDLMFLSNTGNVGIGITAPNAKLDVFSGSAMGLTVEGNSQLYPVVNTYFNVSSNFSNGWAETDIWNAVDPATFTSTGIRFLQRLTASTSRDLMFLSNTGNVGIGLTSPGEPLDVSGIIRGNNEIISSTISGAGQFRMIGGNYGAFFRNDGADTYLLLTASGSQYGSWNSLRPFAVHDSTGAVTMASGVLVGGGLSTDTLTASGSLTANGTLYYPGIANDASGYFVCITSSGGWHLTLGTSSCASSSDLGLKKDVVSLDRAAEFNKIMALRPVSYYWKQPLENDPQGKDRQIGLIAQEVEKVFPEIISKQGNGNLGIHYDKLIAPLVGAVQELKADNDNLRDIVKRQGGEIEDLRRAARAK